jgi:hypothetical protein
MRAPALLCLFGWLVLAGACAGTNTPSGGGGDMAGGPQGVCPNFPQQCGGECCGSECIDTSNDFRHCGGCNNACSMGNLCQGGRCGCPPSGIACPAGQSCCGPDGCKNLQNDVKNCGGCRKACAFGETCDNGQCKCGAGPACTGGLSCCNNACSASCTPPDMATPPPDGGGSNCCPGGCIFFCVGQNCCYEDAILMTCTPDPACIGF